jgi:hypothetical protein
MSLVCHMLLALLLGISSAYGADLVPESGLNAPSDQGKGTSTTAPATTAPTAMQVEPGGIVAGLPVIRLTPRDVMITGAHRGRVDLAGPWDFKHDIPKDFDGRFASITQWDKATVPGHFSWQGFPAMHKEFNTPVAWHRTFKVPPTWKNMRVRLRFESADGLCKTYVNGQLVGTSERVNTPSEFDVTDALRSDGGDNELVVTIETTLATYWSKRTMGGIARAVYLQAVPAVNIARLHVSTTLGATPANVDEVVPAVATAHVRVANDSAEPLGGLHARFTITDGGSQLVPVRLRNSTTPLPPVAAGQMLQMAIPLPVDAVRTWSAESPSLYHMKFELVDPKGDVLMTAQQRFGFREIDSRGGELLLNGRPIKFRGANYHMTFPGEGYFISPDRVRKDLDLFRNMNLNVLRSRPVPMIEYLDHCDEIGMYTTVEGMFTLMMYDKGPLKDHGADPSVGPALREHLAAMLESTRSSPSIITYGLGNENPYYDYFREAAVATQSERTGVPLFFGSDDRNGVDIDFMDINDDHYPRDGRWSIDNRHRITGKGWNYPSDRPNIFTEWAHIAAINMKEFRFDPGTDDFWGYLADLHANWTYDNKHVVGGFLFLAAPEVKTGATFPWRGFFDEYRRPYDMAWHVKKSQSPVRIEDVTLRPDADDGRKASVEITNRYDFLNLQSLEARWEQGGRTGVVRLDVPPRSTRRVTLPVDPNGEPVVLRFVEPGEMIVDLYRLTRADQRPSSTLPTAAVGATLTLQRGEDGTATVTVGDATFAFDADGLLVRGDLAGKAVLAGRPEVVARPTHFRNFQGLQKRVLVNQLMKWKASKVDLTEAADRVTVTATGRYTNAAGTIVTTVHGSGEVNVAYDLTYDGNEPFPCFDWGYAIRVAPEVNELRWTRNAQWSVYPPDAIGRPQGIECASGDPRHAAQRVAYVDEGFAKGGRKPWPWSQDLLDGVTNAFRSTKFQFINGGLYRADGAGVTVAGRPSQTFAGSQHLRSTPVGGNISGEIFTREFFPEDLTGYWLQVLEYHGGSSEPHLTKSLRHEPLTIAKGTKLSGHVRFALAAESLKVDESVNLAEMMP